ncbi:hypothetical protein SAMN05216597_4933 [Pseudomonas cannabina]|nr:hypothetical protein SAMN05216597_4933 [Pseudomonas cannabina]
MPDLSGDHRPFHVLLFRSNQQSGDLAQTFIDTGRGQAIRFISLVLFLSIGTH